MGKHVAVITTDPGPAFRCRNRTANLALLDSRRDGHHYGHGHEIRHEWRDKWVARARSDHRSLSSDELQLPGVKTHAVRAAVKRANRDETHEDHPERETCHEPKIWHASTLPGGRSLRMTFASFLYGLCDNFVVSCDDNVMRVVVPCANLVAWQ